MVRKLETAGVWVIFDAPKPVFRAPAFRCSDWFNASNPVCGAGLEMDRAFLETQREPILAAMLALKNRHPKVAIWDPFPILCPTATCSAYEGNMPLFFDGDHISAHANRVLYPEFSRLVRGLMTAAGPGKPN
jgi:hypothetical protein